MSIGVDILMITHNRPEYTRLSLKRLLDTSEEGTRIWVWHNGSHPETLDIVQSHLAHPRFHKFHQSEENKKLIEPTNWLWSNACGDLIGKVDDDILVPDGWLPALSQAHRAVPRLGAVSCWTFSESDYDPDIAKKKIRYVGGGHSILMHPWIGGGCYIMKRACCKEGGCLQEGQSFPVYTRDLAWRGWINGFYSPLLLADHMDDPHSVNTLFCTEEAFSENMPITAIRQGITTLAEWDSLLRNNANAILNAGTRPGRFFWIRTWPRRWKNLVQRKLDPRYEKQKA